eukprot:1543267-Amphidinium_carterae.1
MPETQKLLLCPGSALIAGCHKPPQWLLHVTPLSDLWTLVGANLGAVEITAVSGCWLALWWRHSLWTKVVKPC